ncbi:MAG TPA: TIGR02679 domain-containing protein [Acetobacterium sp.]
MEKFINAYDETKFRGIDFMEVLPLYFEEELNWKKDLKTLYQKEKTQYFKQLISQFQDTPGALWLGETINQKNNAYPVLTVKYDEDKERLQRLLFQVCQGLNQCIIDPENVRLALFASQITKDPHAFDMNKEGGRLLLYALSYQYKIKYPKNAEEQMELLYTAGLIYDEVSNYTICRGIKAYVANQLHSGWNGFANVGEPLHISLWNISRIDRVSCVKNRVYVFENPTVFSEIAGLLEDRPCSMICSAGNIMVATLLLLDKIVQEGSLIYYGGDFDPEGLIIADKLKKRYGEKLILWHFNPEEYNDIQSKIEISDTRLKKLDGIASQELLEMAEIIRQSGCGAYQELLVDDYMKDIELFLSAD